MQRRLIIYRWFLVTWLVWSCGLSMYARTDALFGTGNREIQTSSWGYAPVYCTSPQKVPNGCFTEFSSSATVRSYGTPLLGWSSSSRSYAPAFSDNVYPAFHFQSTSLHVTRVSNIPAGISLQQRPRKTPSPWDEEPDDDPIGVVPNPAPLGEPLMMLVLALLYVICISLRRLFYGKIVQKNSKKANLFTFFCRNICVCQKKAVLLHPLFERRTKTAGWMSDLVNGLQNRLERFDSATGLQKKVTPKRVTFFF